MTSLPQDVRDAIAAVGADRRSGATSLVLRGIQIMRRAAADAALLRSAARALCLQQPAMAGFRTAAALAVSAGAPGPVLDTLTSRLERNPAAIARIAAPLLHLRRPRREPLRVVTCSRSQVVEQTLKAVAAVQPLQLSCAESRPEREGLGLAGSLAAAGAEVELYSDAAIGAAVQHADVLVLGADALSDSCVINKVGSAGLAALARTCGCHVTVLAGREKILPAPVLDTLQLREGPAAEIAESAGFAVRNPYFEPISTALVDEVVTDRGAVAAEEVTTASLWNDVAISSYMSLMQAGNMLDNH
jgi:hypothetical protein